MLAPPAGTMAGELNGAFALLRVVDGAVAVDAPVGVGDAAAAPPAPEVPPMPMVLVFVFVLYYTITT